MATITATITIDFTANYAGPHRICWRIQGSGNPYDCSTVVNCVGGGTTCQAIITAPVNDTSCDGPITFEGYVQAACQDVLSTSGRLTWTTLFTPTVICERHEITCAYAPINTVNIIDGGLNYVVGDVINITRAGGDTQSLDANIEVLTVDGSGTILTVDIIDGGEYSITPTAFTITTGSGAGADLTFELAPCPTYNGIGTDCDSNTVDLPVGIPVGTTFATCLVGGYTPEPAGYVITQTGCCVAADSSSDVCFDYHLENTTGFGIDVRITHCDGMFELITVPALTIEAMCLISGGVAEPLSPGLIITNTGTPCP